MTNGKRKWTRAFGLLIALAMVAAACGDGGTTDTATPDTTAAAEEEAVSVDPTACNIDPPAEPVTINLLGWGFAATEFYAAELAKCDDVENITTAIELPDYTTAVESVRLGLAAGGDSPWDIIHVTNPEATEFGSAGWLLPLDDLIDKYRDEYNLDDIPQSAWDGAKIDGKLLGVPVIGDSQIIAYRSDLFADLGLEVPVTYDEIIAACGVLADVDGIIIPFAIDFSADWAIEIEFLAAIRSFGGDYLNADNTPSFNSPEGVAALNKMKELGDACMGDAYLAYGYEAGAVGVENGTVAFTSMWATGMDLMSDPDATDFADVISYAPAAAATPGGLLGGTAWHNYYAIPATTTNDPDLIFRAIMEMADAVSQTEGAQFGVVTRLAVTDGVPTLLAVNTTINEGVGPYEPNPAIILVQTALWAVLPLIISGDMTAQDGLDAAADAYIAEATTQGFLP
ncbi:MAG: extracellular solute-binding protein [Acidobacteria bacterium]|nr:extracellular solute-binding protein [Acidobacteriota bacterium]